MAIKLVNDNTPYQLDDDPELLDLMVSDMKNAEEVYQPTNYWSDSVMETIDDLKKSGLTNLRRRTTGAFASFGATEPMPEIFNNMTSKNPNLAAVISQLFRVLNGNILRNLPILPLYLTLGDLYAVMEDLCQSKAIGIWVKSMNGLEASRFGNPYGFESEGCFRTASLYYYYMRYAYVARHINLDEIDTIVELGPGSGKQAEVLKKLHPHLTLVLLDLAPQLYVCERFLNKVFPDAVASYRAGQQPGDITDLEPGKIYFFGNARMADLRECGRTIFWNAASFGEMEPHVVKNYADKISTFADALFLMQRFAGKQLGEVSKGGVLKQTLLKDYQEFFAGYEMVDKAIAHNGLRDLVEEGAHYEDTFWRRKQAV